MKSVSGLAIVPLAKLRIFTILPPDTFTCPHLQEIGCCSDSEIMTSPHLEHWILFSLRSGIFILDHSDHTVASVPVAELR